MKLRKDPGRSITIACFLERQLRLQTDSAIDLYNHLVNDLVRRARNRGVERAARSAASVSRLIGNIKSVAENLDLDADGLRSRILDLLAPFEVPDAVVPSRTHAMREELSEQPGELQRLLGAMDAIKLDLPDDHVLARARQVIRELEPGSRELPDGAQNPFGKAWNAHIAHPDRGRAFTSWQAATALLIKRSLRNGSVSAPHSKTWQNPDKHLIPNRLWEKDRGRFQRNLIRERTSETFLKRIEKGLKGGLEDLAEAARQGKFKIDGSTFTVPREDPVESDQTVKETRHV